MISGNCRLYVSSVEQPSLIRPLTPAEMIVEGFYHRVLTMNAETGMIRISEVQLIPVLSEERVALVKLKEVPMTLEVAPTVTVITEFGKRSLIDMVPIGVALKGIARGIELQSMFLFSYPRAGLYKVISSCEYKDDVPVFGFKCDEDDFVIVNGIALR